MELGGNWGVFDVELRDFDVELSDFDVELRDFCVELRGFRCGTEGRWN